MTKRRKREREENINGGIKTRNKENIEEEGEREEKE
jgi:hypothetical protein